MLLAVVLLYVGAVLVVNGIWLIGQARAAEREAAPTGAPGEADVTGHPTYIENREIAILNIFTGFIGVVAAVTFAIQGTLDEELASIRASGYILLFAFTYLWVAANQFLGARGHAFGWYCLFVSITAVYAGIYTFVNADGNAAAIYLGFDWLAWAFLWFLFFALLSFERGIARFTGWMAILVGIGTSWVFSVLLLEDVLAF